MHKNSATPGARQKLPLDARDIYANMAGLALPTRKDEAENRAINEGDYETDTGGASLQTAYDVVDCQIGRPELTGQQISKLLHLSPTTVSRVLRSPFARLRLDRSRKAITEAIGANVYDALTLHKKVMRRAVREADADNPNPVIMTAATKAADGTLRGVGVFTDHVRQSNSIDANDLRTLIDKQAELVKLLGATPVPSTIIEGVGDPQTAGAGAEEELPPATFAIPGFSAPAEPIVVEPVTEVEADPQSAAESEGN